MERYTGRIEQLMRCNVEPIIQWITKIPFEQWPQQSLTMLKPAMINDLNWNKFGTITQPVVNHIAGALEHKHNNRMLSVVLPHDGIYAHADRQLPEWLGRIHVPLTTNDKAEFILDGESYHLKVGYAYLVNTEKFHEIRNGGETPRIHLMFDLKKG